MANSPRGQLVAVDWRKSQVGRQDSEWVGRMSEVQWSSKWAGRVGGMQQEDGLPGQLEEEPNG